MGSWHRLWTVQANKLGQQSKQFLAELGQKFPRFGGAGILVDKSTKQFILQVLI